MNAKENLMAIHAADGAILTNVYGKTAVKRRQVGRLYIPTGEIVMGDPLTRYGAVDYKRKAFSQRVTPGSYPLMIYTAQYEREMVVAFAELQFSAERPATFTAAKTVYDTEAKRRGRFGYPVSDSRTGFMDASVFHTICALPRYTSAESVFDGNEAFLDIDNHVLCTILSSGDGALTAARITVNSGVYYWYWGLDRRGQICCLAGDFFTYC